jgi:transcriptional regulator with XRE-family HTH domain
MVGLRIEKLRKAAGLSIGDVCKAVDVAPSIYDSFLERRYRFDRAQLRRLADVLGVTTQDLFHAKSNDTTDDVISRKTRSASPKIQVSRPVSTIRKNVSKKTKKQQDTTPKRRPYDADAAADLLAKKFKVTRS